MNKTLLAIAPAIIALFLSVSPAAAEDPEPDKIEEGETEEAEATEEKKTAETKTEESNADDSWEVSMPFVVPETWGIGWITIKGGGSFYDPKGDVPIEDERDEPGEREETDSETSGMPQPFPRR